MFNRKFFSNNQLTLNTPNDVTADQFTATNPAPFLLQFKLT